MSPKPNIIEKCENKLMTRKKKIEITEPESEKKKSKRTSYSQYGVY